jgi:hypothetical protein
MKELGFNVESLSSRNGIAARRIQKAVREVRGYTLYQLQSLDLSGKPGEGTTISIAGRGGISLSMKSRVETPGTLMGTKRIIANTGDLYAGFGKTDKASIVIMPLLGERGLIGHLLLVQVDFRDDMTPPEKREVLGDKYGKIRELTREYNIPWEDSYLEGFSTAFLLGEGLDGIVGAIRPPWGKGGVVMIAILDYEAGNLRSVERALRHLGMDCRITKIREEILKAPRSFFPAWCGGKGHGGHPRQRPGRRYPGGGPPERAFPGICLGAQVLLSESEGNEAPVSGSWR